MLYVALTAGLTVNVRYCHGNIASMDIGEDDSKCCSDNCEMQTKCCFVESLYVQLDIDQHTAHQSLTLNPSVITAFVMTNKELFNFSTNEHQTKFQFTDLSPPLKHPLWLLNCTFTYYG